MACASSSSSTITSVHIRSASYVIKNNYSIFKGKTKKCFTCCITSNRMSTTVSQHRPRYMIIDKVLDTVETVRDLGVIVDHRLKFDVHISSTVHKAMVRARLRAYPQMFCVS